MYVHFSRLFDSLKQEGKVREWKHTWPICTDQVEAGEQFVMEQDGKRAIITGTRYGPVVFYETAANESPKIQAPERIKQLLVWARPVDMTGEEFILGPYAKFGDGLAHGENIGKWIERTQGE